MAQTSATRSEINFDTDMVDFEEGQSNRAVVEYANEEGQSNRAMVIYDKRAKVPDSTIAIRRNTTRKNNPERMLPHTPSKRQYCEVDDSISLREQTHTLMAENGRLVEQHNILTQ